MQGNHDDSWLTENIAELPEPKFTKVRIVDDDGKVHKVMDMDFHPTEKSKLLALVKSDKDEHGDLYYSNTRGESWRKILEDTAKARFGIPEQPHFMSNLIFGIYHREPSALELDRARNYFFTMDAEKAFYANTQLENAAELFVQDKFLFTATMDRKNTIGLHVSTNNGQSFKKIRLPFEDLKENVRICILILNLLGIYLVGWIRRCSIFERVPQSI